MFTEYFAGDGWQELMHGVSSYVFMEELFPCEPSCDIDIQLHPGTVEIIFCAHGELTLLHRSGKLDRLEDRGILMLSDCRDIVGARVSSPMEGVCLSVDCAAARGSLGRLCQVYGELPITMQQICELMEAREGVYLILPQPWTQSAFHAMEHLSSKDRGRYCAMKCFELIYLLYMCKDDPVVGPTRQDNSHLMEMGEEIRTYLMEHLNEKLTIDQVSRSCHLSPTACKTCFRSCFGQSIHRWLLTKRMEKAAELLAHSELTILQIAQAVGYEGCSQFNATFKKTYGISPRQYRDHVHFR